MKTKLQFLIFITISLISCGKKETFTNLNLDTSELKTIRINANEENLPKIDSLFSEVEFLKLQTTDKNLIGTIAQIIFLDSLILITDNSSAKSIYEFHNDGSFYRQIGNIGNGPNEYVSIDHVTPISNKKIISVLDLSQQKVIYYNYKGEFNSSEQMKFPYLYCEYLKTGEKVYYTSGLKGAGYPDWEENTLTVADTKNQILYGGFMNTYDTQKFTYTTSLPIRNFASEIYYAPSFSDTIYKIAKESVIAKYLIDIEWNKMPEIGRETTDEKFSDDTHRYFYFNGDFIEYNTPKNLDRKKENYICAK